MVTESQYHQLERDWLETRQQVRQLRLELENAETRERRLRDMLRDRDILSANLTPRQCNVLKLVRTGKSNKEIASDLFIAERTVKFHVSALLTRFKVENRTGLRELMP